MDVDTILNMTEEEFADIWAHDSLAVMNSCIDDLLNMHGKTEA